MPIEELISEVDELNKAHADELANLHTHYKAALADQQEAHNRYAGSMNRQAVALIDFARGCVTPVPFNDAPDFHQVLSAISALHQRIETLNGQLASARQFAASLRDFTNSLGQPQ